MRQFIDQHEVACSGDRRDDAHIGEIPRPEYARGRRALEAGKALLQRSEQRVITGDESRGAGAGAVAIERLDGGGFDRRMVREIEIVVATERQEAAAVAQYPAAVLAVGIHQYAMEAGAIERPQFLCRKVVERLHSRL